MGNGQIAAAEFQKVIDHPGIVGRSVLGALARLQLGRAHITSGDKTAARESYAAFPSPVEDVDPDVPVYKQAKVELSRLQ